MAGGSAIAGLAVAVLRRAGADEALAVQLSYAVGTAATLAALALWRPERRGGPAGASRRIRPRADPMAIAMQLPDLLLVSALAMMLPLVPLVLVRQFHLAPVVVGLTFAGVQAGKVGGTLAGRVTCREHGHRVAILILLGSGAVLSLLLSVSTSLVGAPLFVLVLIATAFVTTGAWPLIVDSALARTEPSHRRGHDRHLERLRVWRHRRHDRDVGLAARQLPPAGAPLHLRGRPARGSGCGGGGGAVPARLRPDFAVEAALEPVP